MILLKAGAFYDIRYGVGTRDAQVATAMAAKKLQKQKRFTENTNQHLIDMMRELYPRSRRAR